MKSALLLSGGMDSIAIAWWKRPDFGITIDYGQLPAQAELDAAGAVCRALAIEHHRIVLDCRGLGSGDMAGVAADPHAPASDWWPYRNQMLATFGAMRAISLQVGRLLIGSVRSDGIHRDGTPEFVRRLNDLMAMQEGGMVIEAPAIALSTTELIRSAQIPRSVLGWAHSCHKANVPCGTCRGCSKHALVLQELEFELDPTWQSSPAV